MQKKQFDKIQCTSFVNIFDKLVKKTKRSVS